MSSSVVSTAQWSGQLAHNSPADSTPNGRRGKTVTSTKLTNGNGSSEKKKHKSISPVPTTSTRSTRSRRTVAYGESDSPDLPPRPLPSVPATKPVSKKKKTAPKPRVSGTSTRMAKTASTNSVQSLPTQSPTSPTSTLEYAEIEDHIVAEPPSIPAPKSQGQGELKTIITPEPVKADLPPSTSTLKISFKTTANGGIKRLAASQDPDDASTTYDATPRVSPTPDATINGVDVEVQGEELKDAPKRAPRKKRKWLKRGQIDPDDPVAVAKQQERFSLLDQADEQLERHMAAVRDGTHPDLVGLLAQLESRRDTQLQHAEQRHELQKAEILKTKQQGQAQARSDQYEASETIMADILVDLRRKKHALVNERLQINRTPDSYPLLAFGRGSRGWALHTKRLISNHEQPMVHFELDGEIRQRKDTTTKLQTLSTMEAKADLEFFKTAASEKDTLPSPDKRLRHIAKGDLSRQAGPSRLPGTAPLTQSSTPVVKNRIWAAKNAYDVKDLPPYKAGSGSIPMRQTPTHSPTPTPSRRPSPPPQQPAGRPTAGPRPPSPPRPAAGPRPVGSGSNPAVHSSLSNGTGVVPRPPSHFLSASLKPI